MKPKARRTWRQTLRQECSRAVSPLAGAVVVCLMIGLALAIVAALHP